MQPGLGPSQLRRRGGGQWRPHPACAQAAPLDDHVRVLGPAEAPLAVVRGRYRYRLLIKSPRNFDLSYYVRGWLEHAPKPRGSLKLEVDIDPQSFY